MTKVIYSACATLLCLSMTTAMAWDPDKIEELHAKAEEAKAEMLDSDPDMQRFYDSAVAWVIIPTVGKVDVELVFDPPWNMEMMSEAARLEAGMM